jgi:integrase/recombinase XerC
MTDDLSPSTSLVPITAATAVQRPLDAHVLIARWQEGRSPYTVRAYGRDLAYFARWSEASAAGEAISRLLTGSMGEANERLHAYRGAMLDEGLAPATVNRRLSALRSIIRLGRTFGLISWSVEIDGVKGKAFRDTAGPGVDGVTAVKRQAAQHVRPAKAARDVAIVRVLFDLALRRGEVAGLELEHFDARASRLSILGKGRREREWRTLPPRTLAALNTWLKYRGKKPGPLFINFHFANKGLDRLEANGIYWVVRSLADKAEIRARPHGMRHTSITAGLDRTRDPRKVRQHARHASMDTTMLYDDARADFAGEVARIVSETLEE